MSEQQDNTIGRRGLFRLGGLGLATAVVAAACNDTKNNEIGRIGVGDSVPQLPDGVVDDQALLRTAASVELSIVRAYQMMLDKGVLAEPSPTYPDLGDQTDLVTLFRDHHEKAAKVFNDEAVANGAEAFECGNPRMDSVQIDPIFARVFEGVPATDTAPAIPPSDDPVRDMVNLVYSLESLSAATSQAFVTQYSQPPMRQRSMEVGVRSARQSALMSLQLNPTGYVSSTDAENANPGAPTTTVAETTTTQDIAAPTEGSTPAEEAPPQTPIPLPVAVPTVFGSLAAITWIGGTGDENGVRMKVNFETPSLNSMVYEFTTCEA